MIRLFCSCFITLVLVTANLFAQNKREYSGLFDTYYYRGPFSITGGAGTSIYNGNLSGSPSYAFNLGVSYKVWPRIAFGAEFLYFQMKGSKTTDSSSFAFTSPGIELDLYARFYIIDDIVRISNDRAKKPKLLKPYITTGIGFLRYHPTSTYVINNFTVPASEGVTKAGYTPVIPLGVGVTIGVSPRVSILAEASYRYMLTDFVDYTNNRVGAGLANGYMLACVRVQYSPFAPKQKKKAKAGAPPAQYDGPKGTETWKNRKKEPARNQEEYPPLPGEEQPQNGDNPENQDQNQNEGGENQQNEGGENQENQQEETPSPKQ